MFQKASTAYSGGVPSTAADSETASLASLVASESRPRTLGTWVGWMTSLPLIGGLLARMLRLPNRAGAATTLLTRMHGWLLTRSGGRLRRSWLFAAGQPVIALTTVGRRTGEPRTTAVACFTSGEELAVAGMNLGLPRNPAWALNLEANPDATIVLAGRTIHVRARRASGEDAERLWRRWLQVQPSAEAFRDLASRDIPLFVLSRADS
jgi:deazaflavin-dependent oxidoreductase (nitroreductase family)